VITVKERRDLVVKLAEARLALVQEVGRLPAPRLTTPAKDGDRSPLAMLLHIITTEQMYRDQWAKRARDEESPDLVINSAVTQVIEPGFGEANRMDVPTLLASLEAERVLTLAFIAETADSEFDRVGKNSLFGDLTLHQYLKSLYRHDLMHVDEMAGRSGRYQITTQDGRKL
jgi:hypothetical protein